MTDSGAPLVIIPTYNEVAALPALISRLLDLPMMLDVLIVDDTSPDGTGALADTFTATHPQIHVLHRPRKNGYRFAIEAGFSYAIHHRYHYALTMDADLSHAPDSITDLLAAMSHADLALGSRYSNGIRCHNWTIGRLLSSYYGNAYLTTLTRMPFHDITTGFRCYRTSTLAAINFQRLHSRGYAFLPELAYVLWRQGARLTEVPILYANRTVGLSKISAGIAAEAILLPYRLAASRIRWGFRPHPTPHQAVQTTDRSQDIQHHLPR